MSDQPVVGKIEFGPFDPLTLHGAQKIAIERGDDVLRLNAELFALRAYAVALRAVADKVRGTHLRLWRQVAHNNLGCDCCGCQWDTPATEHHSEGCVVGMALDAIALCPDSDHTAAELALRHETRNHVCGLAGYNGMIDPPCPACEDSRHQSCTQDDATDAARWRALLTERPSCLFGHESGEPTWVLRWRGPYSPNFTMAVDALRHQVGRDVQPFDYEATVRAFHAWLDSRPAGFSGEDVVNPGGRWFDAFVAGARSQSVANSKPKSLLRDPVTSQPSDAPLGGIVNKPAGVA